jgi:N-glycosylase/DNA lyase
VPVFYFLKGDKLLSRETPDPEAEVLPEIRWGRFDVLFTPAYWMTQYWIREGNIPVFGHRLGSTFEEEVVACMLGSHGVPAEVGIAAFQRLRDRGVFKSSSCTHELLSAHLKEPLVVGERRVTYRFWSQKARYVAAALDSLRTEVVPMGSPIPLRDYLMRLQGVGPKIASWIVRNWLHSNEVAILDIHVVRAGLLMNLFSSEDKVEKDYMRMERRFLSFVKALEVEASHLDALFWEKMRSTPHIVSSCLNGNRPPQITGSHLHP